MAFMVVVVRGPFCLMRMTDEVRSGVYGIFKEGKRWVCWPQYLGCIGRWGERGKCDRYGIDR